ncbi:hypothetical protein ACOMHN_055149 [Nucella lapillus]
MLPPGLVEGSEELPYSCRNCGMCYKHEQTMTRHRKKCEGVYNLECQVCGKRYYRRDKLRDHMRRQHNVTDFPFSYFVLATELFSPGMNGGGTDVVYHCVPILENFDSEIAPFPIGLSLSPMLGQMGGIGVFTCTHCGKQYRHAPGLSRHRKQCAGRYDMACHICGKLFYRRDNLKDHIKKHGVVDTAQPESSSLDLSCPSPS